MRTITIEQLAEKINGKLWVKGDLKRIYIDAGWNTKKMSTKTYIYQTEHGSFGVSCYIECPSQPYQWIKSQQEEVIKSVERQIEDALSTEVFVFQNKNGEYLNWKGEVAPQNDAKYFISEKDAKTEQEENSDLENAKIVVMERETFEAEVDRLDEIEREKKRIESQQKKESPVKEENTITYELGNGKKVNHVRFGLGEIIEETEEKLKIIFQTEGEKILLKKITPLTYINE